MDVNTKFRLKKILTFVLVCLMFVFGGLGILFIAPQSDNPAEAYVIGVFTLIFFGGALIYGFIKLFRNPTEFWKKQKEWQEKVNKSPYLSQVTKPWEQDIKVFKILKKNFLLGIPYLISLFLIVAFLIFEFKHFFILSLVKNLIKPFFILHLIKTPIFGTIGLIFFYPYVLSFICFSFYVLGYLVLGELLQRKLSLAKRNILVDLGIDYIRAIPFTAILSLVWIIFLFTKDKEDRNLPTSFLNALRRFSLYGLFIIIKYYTYINLAIIAFEDKRITISFRESFDFFRKERINMLLIWVKSGFIFGIAFLISSILMMWNEKFNFMDRKILMIPSGFLFLFAIIFGLFSEQLSFLLYFIKTRHKECNLGELYT